MRLTAPKVTISYMLDTRYSKKSDTYPLKLRLSYCGERNFIKTRIELTKAEFQAIKNGTCRGALMDIRYKMDKEKVRAHDLIETMQSFNFTEFKRLFGITGTARTLPWYFKDYINILTLKRQVGTAAHYKTALNVFSEYYGRQFSFKHLTPILLEQFEDHYERIGRSMGTVGVYMRALRAIYNRALRDYTINELDYPFGRDKYIIPSIRKRKTGIKPFYIREIHLHPLESPFHQFHRDLWIFSFHCNGMNMKDIAYLKYGNIQNNSLTIIRSKTKRTRKREQISIRIHLNKHAQAIIERWGNDDKSANNFIFPILEDSMDDREQLRRLKQTTQNTRLLVQRIASEKDWSFPINFQSARHSFGNMLQRSKQPDHVIQQAFGHSDIKTTQHYMEDLEQEKQQELSSLTEYEL